MINWLARIRDLVDVDPDGDPRVLARKLLEALDAEELVTLIAEEIEHQQRRLTRFTEHEAFGQLHDWPTSNQLTKEHRPAWDTLLGTPFKLGTGERVAWGQATVVQHEQRCALLRKLRDGLNTTIGFHEQAIRLITQAGVTCLDEIELVA